VSSQAQITGNIFIFHAFDIGDELDLDAIVEKHLVKTVAKPLATYFKNYHIPISVQLPVNSPSCESAKLHNFGVITLRYRVPFANTFDDLRSTVIAIDHQYEQQSERDAAALFDLVRSEAKQAGFFHVRNSYMLIQLDKSIPGAPDIQTIKREYGDVIASLLRFEEETLSEHQKNEVLTGALSYYHTDLVIIDTHAALIRDDEYEETLDLFEFANMQYLELHYFDRMLDKQLNLAYEQDRKSPGIKSYLPFIGAMVYDPVSELNKLKVDISVITDRLETSIKLSGEAYFSKIYTLLSERLDLANWKESISRKLDIIHDIVSMYEHKLEVIREDLLTCSIIVLIMLELLLGFFSITRH
jgi:hypothetical protein